MSKFNRREFLKLLGAGGIAAGTPFEDIPEDWVCPICQVSKDMFEPATDEQ